MNLLHQTGQFMHFYGVHSSHDVEKLHTFFFLNTYIYICHHFKTYLFHKFCFGFIDLQHVS